IVEESAEEDGSEGSNPTPEALAGLSTGRGKSFTAELAAVSDGEYNRVAQGELKGEKGTRIGFVIPGSNDPVFVGHQGERVRVTDATIRTDEDGLKEVVVNDATGVEFVDWPDETQASVDDAAAADGGETSGRDAVPQYTQSVAETVKNAGEPVGVAYIIQNTEGSPEPLREAIDAAREQGKITKEGDDKYVV
ncbi:hypothetical protein ACOJIV_20575, partial [Haloarcula sp. AONF1]